LITSDDKVLSRYAARFFSDAIGRSALRQILQLTAVVAAEPVAAANRLASMEEAFPDLSPYTMQFGGEALEQIDKLAPSLRNVDNREGVVMRALALLQAAQGKHVVLQDPDSGTSERINL
jgi:hypothetical protein